MDRTSTDSGSERGRYGIDRRLGSGGFGVVYLALDHERGERVALKTLHRMDPAGLYALKSEFRLLADLTHPNLVALYELVSEHQQWFFTMEFVDGLPFLDYVRGDEFSAPVALGSTLRSLEEALADPPSETARSSDPVAWAAIQLPSAAIDAATLDAEGVTQVSGELDEGSPTAEPALSGPAANWSLDVDRLRDALRQLTEGVDALHQAGFLHRDLKPENVLLDRQGRVVILDFGLATHRRPASRKQGAVITGSPAFMAPEQAAGSEACQASDWYAVGAMLYVALTGRIPFEGSVREVLRAKQCREAPRPAEINPGVPEDLDHLCSELLRLRPEDRPTASDVRARLGTATRLTRLRAPEMWPKFIGRADELRLLRDAYEVSLVGTPVCVLVHGPSGAGKSTLVRSFLDSLDSRGETLVLSGRCYERESVPYKGFDALIDSLSNHLRDLPRDDVLALLPRDTRELARVFPVLKRAAPISELAARRVEPRDALEVRRRAFRALKELLGRIADQRPLVLYVDDLQWNDLDSARLLIEILSPPELPTLLFVGTYRSEESERSASLRELQSWMETVETRLVAVGPLSVEDGAALALHRLGVSDAEGRRRAQQIAEEAEGNPFFIEELASLGDTDAGRGELSLEQVVLARVGDLSADARRLLEAVAVAGRPITQSCVQQAVGGDSDFQRAWRELRAARLVRRHGTHAGDAVESDHDRIRECVTARLQPAALREIHGRLARALRERGAADPDQLAVHFAGAGELELAAHYALEAAERAREALAFGRAAELYGLAVECTTGDPDAKQDLRKRQAHALVAAGRCGDAAAVFLEAAKGAKRAEAIELQTHAAEQLLVSGRAQEGWNLLRSVLPEIGLDLSLTARGSFRRVVWTLAKLALRGTRFRDRDVDSLSPKEVRKIDLCWSVGKGLLFWYELEGSVFLNQSLWLALRGGDRFRIVRSLATYSMLLSAMSERRGAKAFGRAMALAEELNDSYLRGTVQLWRGVARANLGRCRQAVEDLDGAVVLLRDRCAGVEWECSIGEQRGMQALVTMGELRELASRLPARYRRADELGDRYAAVFASLFSALCEIAQDAPDAARRRAVRAAEAWPVELFCYQHWLALSVEIQCDLYEGKGAAALDKLQAAWPRIKNTSYLLTATHSRIELRQVLAATLLAAAAAGGTDAAANRKEALQEAKRLQREKRLDAAAAAALIRATAAWQTGRRDLAIDELEAAISLGERSGQALFVAAARRRKGELVGGDSGAALIAQADAAMAEQQIAAPARWVEVYAPGFGSA